MAINALDQMMENILNAETVGAGVKVFDVPSQQWIDPVGYSGAGTYQRVQSAPRYDSTYGWYYPPQHFRAVQQWMGSETEGALRRNAEESAADWGTQAARNQQNIDFFRQQNEAEAPVAPGSTLAPSSIPAVRNLGGPVDFLQKDPYGLYDEYGSTPSPWWQGAGYYAQTSPGGGDAFTSWGPGYEYLGAVGSEMPLGGLLRGVALDAPTVSDDPWSGAQYLGNIRYTPNIDFRSLNMQVPGGSAMPVGDAALQDYMTQTYGSALNALVGSTTQRLSPDQFSTPAGISYNQGWQGHSPWLSSDPMVMAKLLSQVPGAAEDPSLAMGSDLAIP